MKSTDITLSNFNFKLKLKPTPLKMIPAFICICFTGKQTDWAGVSIKEVVKVIQVLHVFLAPTGALYAYTIAYTLWYTS